MSTPAGQAYAAPGYSSTGYASSGAYGYSSGPSQAKKPKQVSSGAPSYAASYDNSSGYGNSGYDNSSGYGGYDYSSYYNQSSYYSSSNTQPPLPKQPPPQPEVPKNPLSKMADPSNYTKSSNGGNFGNTRGRGGGGRGGAWGGSQGNRGGNQGNRGGSQGYRGSNPGFRGGGHARGIGPRPPVIKPKGPPPMTSEQRSRIENNNLKQLVAPKPPHKILNEMMGGKVAYEYAENPPLPPGAEQFDEVHTLTVEIDGEKSSGTGPSHDIAKNICSEHAIMGVVARRYDAINEMVTKGLKSKDELLLEDETPFELASMAIYKMLNEWEAKGYELPQDLEDILYTSHLYLPVKERLSWIRGSNLGYFTPIEGPKAANQRPGMRKKPMQMPSQDAIGQKNPVAFLNEIRGQVEYVELGAYGQTPDNMTYTVGTNIDGVPYSGVGESKKDAKKNCAIDVLTRLYRINVPAC